MKFVQDHVNELKGGWFMFWLTFIVLIGCGGEKALFKEKPYDVSYNTPAYIPKRDTIPKTAQRTWTTEQLTKFIAAQYQSNYDRLFAPDFKRLNGIADKQSSIIQDQANTLKAQGGYLIEYRRRMDSIAKDRNMERRQKIMAQDSQVYWQKRAINIQEKLIAVINQQGQEAKDQSRASRVIAYCSLVCVVFILLLFLYLLYRIRSISKRVDGLIENQSNA